MHIGLFGGSFDPVHLGHQLVVDQVLSHHIFDEVWYIPVGNHDFGKTLTTSSHRIAMLELVAQPGTKIETLEIDSPEVSYTHATLTQLQTRFPEHRFSWVIGSDQMESLYKWGCAVESACFPALLKEFTFYVYPRAGYPITLPYPELVPLTQLTEIEVSSTEIRRRQKTREAITGLVDLRVEAYIEKNKLFKPSF